MYPFLTNQLTLCGWHSTKVALAPLTQKPQAQFSVVPFPYEIYQAALHVSGQWQSMEPIKYHLVHGFVNLVRDK